MTVHAGALSDRVRQIHISDAKSLNLAEIALVIHFLKAVDELVIFRSDRKNKFAANLELFDQSRRNLLSASTDMNGVIRSSLNEPLPAVTADEHDLTGVQLSRIRLGQILTRQVDQSVDMLDSDNSRASLVATNGLVEGSAQDTRAVSDVKDSGSGL